METAENSEIRAVHYTGILLKIGSDTVDLTRPLTDCIDHTSTGCDNGACRNFHLSHVQRLKTPSYRGCSMSLEHAADGDAWRQNC
jgi:hypothetical protein